MEASTAMTPGHWYWKEETQTLEFLSFNTSLDFKERKKKKNKGIHFQEISGKHGDRSTPSTLNKGLGNMKTPGGIKVGGRMQGLTQASPRPGKGHHEFVTLKDVKNAALLLLQEAEPNRIPSCFSEVIRSQQLDDFLMSMLSYLSCYLERIALEKKPKSLMTEPSLTERRNMAEASAKLELAQNNLAQMYSVLVLGLGMEQQHHMSCGKSRVSSTRKDRLLFECLYSFCIYVAWVTFRHRNLNVIQEEVGRLLRSDTFNPALRIKITAKENSKNGATGDRNKAPPAEYRKVSTKRPAIKSIVHQRSPMLISLLPSPKEKAQYLFRPHRVQVDRTSGTYSKENMMETLSDAFSSKVGIIGELRNHFNHHTLIPMGAEHEDEEEHEKEGDNTGKKSSSTFYSQGLASPFQRDNRSRLSRQNTAISRATTEGAYSDTD